MQSLRPRAIAALLTAIVFTSVALADVPEDVPENVLFVGNSFSYYNNGLQNHYRRLLHAASPSGRAPGRARLITISGGSLAEHRGGLEQMLAASAWDAVVLQGYSLGPIAPERAPLFRESASLLASRIRDAGAEPVFFMTWAYLSRPEMITELDAAYTAVANEAGAEVVPVGRAFELVRNGRDDIALIMSDDKHPTLAGTYLAACTFFAALQGASPVGLGYTAGLDADTAAYLQAAAWRAVQEYTGT